MMRFESLASGFACSLQISYCPSPAAFASLPDLTPDSTSVNKRFEGLTMRLEPASIDQVDDYTRTVLRAQERHWGAPLINHLVYARVPAIFKAVRSMWTGIPALGQVDDALQALVNRRVAALNQCDF